ncbi:MAG: translocation/assembly module TamB domain-containing protein [Shimia sp.]
MWRFLCVLLLWPASVSAQDDDRGLIVGFLEDNLSSAGREVRIEGFAGALSSRATLDRLTIADAEGVWLTLEGAELDWNRSALLRGRLEVEALTATSLSIPRAPVTEEEAPSPEAQPITIPTIPDLPVSIAIERFAIDVLRLGEPILGQAAEFSLSGDALLQGGALDTALALRRTDGQEGEITLALDYNPDQEQATLDLRAAEGPGGIVASLAGIEGEPALTLTATGAGPLDAFAADITLDTDGVRSLEGRVETAARGDDFAVTVDLAGDLAPLVAPDYTEFLGGEQRLAAQATRAGDGALRLDDLTLETAAFTAEGQAALAAEGGIDSADLTLTLTPTDGARVTLPVGEPALDVGPGTISVALADDEWEVAADITDVLRDGIAIAALTLDGAGTRGADGAEGRVDFAAEGLSLPDAALQTAVGEALTGGFDLDWTRDGAVELSALELSGANYALAGTVSVLGVDGEVDLEIEPELGLVAQDLSRFAPLAGLDGLAGRAELSVVGDVRPVAGAFDLAVSGTTTELAFGQPQLDGLVGGDGTLAVQVQRDETGLTLRDLRVETPGTEVTGTARVATEDVEAQLRIFIADAARVDERLDGPLTVRADVMGALEAFDAGLEITGPGGAIARATAQVSPEAVPFTVALDAPRLDPFGVFAGLDLTGAAEVVAVGTFDRAASVLTADVLARLDDVQTGIAQADELLAGDVSLAANLRQEGQEIALRDLSIDGARVALTGDATLDGAEREAQIDARVTDIATGVPQADALLRGTTDISADVAQGAGGIVVRALDISGENLSARGTARYGDAAREADVTLRLADPSVVLAGLPGPVTLDLDAQNVNGGWSILADLAAAGGLDATLDARLPEDFATYEATLEAAVDSLAPYRGIANLPLSGALRLNAEGSGPIADGAAFDGDISLTGQNLGIGNPQVNRLIGGTTTATFAGRLAPGDIRFDTLSLTTPELTANASGTLGADGARTVIDARLRDLGLFAEGINGPATAQGQVAQSGDTLDVALDLTGPAGVTGRVDGTLNTAAQRGDLAITGDVPLALANTFTAPALIGGRAAIDLRLNGPLAVSSLSGRVDLRDASVVSPQLPATIEGIGGGVDLSGGRAQVDVTASLSTGGTARLSGPITLSGGYRAELTLALDRIRVEDPGLYEALADGLLRVSGPLTARPAISGEIVLDEVEVRVPDGGGVAGSPLPELQHRGIPTAVQRTRVRAGLVEDASEGDTATGGAAGFPLDVVIRAPSRIFVRGRGLDAELGGELLLQGTTGSIIPQGAFNLIRGRLDILGNRLVLDEASLRILGDFDAFLRVVATTESGGALVSIIIEGVASDPELRIESVPDLPQDEALARLLFGQTLADMSAFQALRIAAAIRTLQGGGGGLLDSVREDLSLSDLDITTTDDGNAAVRAGRYIDENIYTDVTVDSAGRSEINLNIDLTPDITVRGGTASDGNTSIGIFFERDY